MPIAPFELIDPQMTDDQFVRHVYRTVLGRDVDPGGLATYVDMLSNGMARGQIIDIVRHSDEAAIRFQTEEEGRAIAHLLFSKSAAVLGGPIVARIAEVGSVETWNEAIRLVNEQHRQLDETAVALLFGPVVGFIEQLGTDMVHGWVLVDAGEEVEVFIDNLSIGRVACRYQVDGMKSERFVNAWCGFRVPIREGVLSSAGIHLCRVRVRGMDLPPRGRLIAPWLQSRIDSYNRTHVHKFQNFQVEAFRKI